MDKVIFMSQKYQIRKNLGDKAYPYFLHYPDIYSMKKENRTGDEIIYENIHKRTSKRDDN